MNQIDDLLKIASLFDELSRFIKIAVIKKLPDGKYRVLSEKGKNLGTFPSKSQAEKRLKQIEYFKRLDKNDSNDLAIDLTDIDDFSYSAIMRKLRKKAGKEQVRIFLKIFKNCFDAAIKEKLQKPEKIALQNSLVKFNKIHKIKLNQKMVKNATVSELGDPAKVGKYLADMAKFTLNRIDPSKRPTAILNLRNKIYHLDENEIAMKNLPPSASMGQSITFIKHVLFNHDPKYVREVLNHISGNLQ